MLEERLRPANRSYLPVQLLDQEQTSNMRSQVVQQSFRAAIAGDVL
jgi:hypothetical protein